MNSNWLRVGFNTNIHELIEKNEKIIPAYLEVINIFRKKSRTQSIILKFYLQLKVINIYLYLDLDRGQR